MDKQIRKENLKQLQQEYGESFQQALVSQSLTPEEFSDLSKIPPEIIEGNLNGNLRVIGSFNYIASCLNKRVKIELVD